MSGAAACLAGGSALGAPAPAAQPPLPDHPLTVGEVVKLAIDRNPDVRTAREKINELHADEQIAIAKIFPTVQFMVNTEMKQDSFSGGVALYGGDAYNYYSGAFSLNQPLFDGGAILAGLSLSKKTERQYQVLLEMTERDLTVNVLTSFYGVLYDQRSYQVLKDTEKVLKETLAVSNYRYRIGRGQLLDVLQIKTEIAQLQPQITTAENQTKIDAATLASLLGDRQSTQMQIIGSLDPFNAEQVAAHTVETLKSEPSHVLEFENQDLILDEFENTRTITLAPNYPQLAFIADFGRQATAKSDLLEPYSTYWDVGIQLTIPIFTGLSSYYQRHQLASQSEQLDIANSKLHDTIALDQVTTERTLESSRSVVASSREALDLARQSLEEARRQYKLATIDYLQYLTAQSNLLGAESTYAGARRDYIVNLAKFYVAEGYPIQELVSQLAGRNP